MLDKFAIFICTHGRPNKQSTLKALRSQGYTGKVYLVLDDTDKSIQQYINNFGTDNLIIFNKQHYIDTVDTGVVPPNYKTILYAKVAVEDIAKHMTLTSFVIADDDITKFRIRYIVEDSLRSFSEVELDKIFEAYNTYLLEANFTALGVCSNVQLIAGKSVFNPDIIAKFRTPYNFVFRNITKEVNWVSSFGEDIITAINSNKRGSLMWSIPYCQIDLTPPGSCADGGMSEVYKSISTFKLCEYDFMYNPSSILLRTHGKVWNAQILKNQAFPKIVSDKYKKEK